jgi:hypothetical protein
VTNKLPQLTVLVPVASLIMCHVTGELSPEDSYANGLVMFFWITHSHHLHLKYKWQDKATFRLRILYICI